MSGLRGRSRERNDSMYPVRAAERARFRSKDECIEQALHGTGDPVWLGQWRYCRWCGCAMIAEKYDERCAAVAGGNAERCWLTKGHEGAHRDSIGAFFVDDARSSASQNGATDLQGPAKDE
jgi:hypothetical protein